MQRYKKILGKSKFYFLQALLLTVMKECIFPPNSPKPIAPYSPAVALGNLVFVSGQIAIDAATGNLVMDSITVETNQVMHNLKIVLEAAGSSLDKIVKATIFMSSMSHYAEMNEAYGKFFTSDYPAREAVAVAGLPRGVNVEISVIAER